MTVSLTFLGAAGTTTGSRYLLTTDGEKILIDCGLFAGPKELRLKNREAFPSDPSEIDAVLLTHSHLESAGYLPLLVKQGFYGKIYCSEATKDLCSIVLTKQAYVQEEEAQLANKNGYSKHTPPRPLYTLEECQRALKQLVAIKWDEDFEVGKEIQACFHYAGHIVGAAHVIVETKEIKILFSGDLGRPWDPLLLAPTNISEANYVVLESTYGDCRHTTLEPLQEILEAIEKVLEEKGKILICASTLCRTKLLLLYLKELQSTHKIPKIPIFVDSPLAANYSELFKKYTNEVRLTQKQVQEAFESAVYVNSLDQSKELSKRSDSMIIIAGNEMATEGRILQHLKSFGGDPNNLILLLGYQASGTRGFRLANGEKAVKIHGSLWPIRAKVRQLHSFSSQADYIEILEWLKASNLKPSKVFITHGEPSASKSLKAKIEEQFHWDSYEPHLGESISLPNLQDTLPKQAIK